MLGSGLGLGVRVRVNQRDHLGEGARSRSVVITPVRSVVITPASSVVITSVRSVVITPAILSEQVGRLQQSIALLPKNCLEQSPDRSTSDAPITRPPTLRDFSLLRCLGTGGYAEVCLAPYISLYLPMSPYISLCLLISPCVSLHLPISPLHLPYISPTSPRCGSRRSALPAMSLRSRRPTP